MPKGSQLSQLKAALSQAGLTGSQGKGKKRKRSAGLAEKDKAKKAAKLDEIHRKLNPFDVKVTRLKHDVGGRKIKGVVGRPAQSRMAGIEQRKKTLLKEYEERNRAGGILDRRFGENDPTMSLEERMLERFTRERQRAAKASAFNLEDEDELTHYGQSLSNLDDFDDVGLMLDEHEEEEGDEINKEIVQKTHFGGFEDGSEDEEPARKKTKAEVMAEVIAKSKEHKLLRQVEREKGDTIRQKLDKDFDALRELLYVKPTTGDSLLSEQSSTHPDASDPSKSSDLKTPEDQLLLASQDQDYDQHVRELAFDKRAKPKDRTKTEEELALQQKEALEKAERGRRRRMLGLDESESEEEGKGRKRKRGGDDLEDDFEFEGEAWGGLGAGLEDSASGDEVSHDESNDEEVEEDGDEEQDSNWESGDGERGEQEELVTSKRKGEANEKQNFSSAQELPYTFSCPETHDDFLEIVEGVDENDIPTIIQRIRALHHTSLAAENKFKLQALTAVLIDHVLHITASPHPQFNLLSSLLSHLASLTKAYPTQSAVHFIKKLVLMQKNLKHGLSQGPLNPESKTWPGLSELTLLRVIGVLWSTSDLNHAVVSPARLLMGSYLGLCRVRSIADLTSGLFLCTLFLQYESLSKRFVPEAINFMINAVLHLVPQGYESVAVIPGCFPSPDVHSEPCQKLRIRSKPGEVIYPGTANLPTLFATQDYAEQAKVDLLALALNLLGSFADMYKGLEAFVDLYGPILDIVRYIQGQELKGLQSCIDSLQDMLSRLLKFARQSRQPLQLQSHKRIPIPTYIPKFDTSSSSYMRNKDPDHERNEAAKLRRQYKQERKGAIRELRKDARFLAGVTLQKQLDKDRAYNERMKRVFGSMEGERAEEKAMEREKLKDKRRAGRR
ncbi:hypothetical protein APHAL10511_001628 [Amanita phalloides]|nr:hypothetical protein APHAL10511_001628 [Amanita phalloides]